MKPTIAIPPLGKKLHQTVSSPPSLLLVMTTIALSSAMGGLALLGILNLGQRIFKFTKEVAPAEIPFKTDIVSCEKSGRSWQADQCLDYDHNPMF
jgi:hypothetical protein